jgi:alkaline ceramidase
MYVISSIDWCEPNYVYSKYIAEFWNTISNITFLILGYYGFKYCKKNILNSTYYLIFTIYILIGIFSAYFHASLTLIGQLLDEIGIYLVIVTGLCSYMDINMLITLPFLLILFIYPNYNPYLLFTLSSVVFYKVYVSFTKMNNTQKRLILVIIIIFFISVFFWVFDKICYFEGDIHTHFIFHITIAVTGFLAIVFLDYVKNNRKDHNVLKEVFNIV